MKKYIIILALMLFGASSSFGQWIYQSLPAYYEVKDIKFFDANTGIIILGSTNPGMLKTTNGGNNWTLFDTTVYYYGLQTIDSVTMYAYGQRTSIYRIKRTFDRGITWDSVSVSSARMFWDFSFVNKDTGWVSGFNGDYVIWRTTNGGVTLVPQTGGIGNGAIFFLKQKVNGEYYGWQNNFDELWRTTNSGVNWFQVTAPAAPYLFYIQFVDGNTGWFSAGYNGIYKTTNGGSNWVNQPLAPGIPQIISGMTHFICINKDTIYGIGSAKMLQNRVVGIVWKTTNGGLNWGYQQPDTNYYNGAYASIDFINANSGWAYGGNGVHTTNGGGVILYPTYVINNSTEITNYEMKQNYPNPFNPVTTIEFNLPKVSYVNLSIYDITGKSIINVINGFLLSGGTHRYRIEEFGKLNLSSGTYFYRLEARDINGAVVFNKTKRMIYMK
ncbi:MAG: T9SS type A sorting domain-containing protein [Ignavibacteriae bacterium]|nr:T9SS type A sorting domain-containing protein [Ignavibacteriota bacterium]